MALVLTVMGVVILQGDEGEDMLERWEMAPHITVLVIAISALVFTSPIGHALWLHARFVASAHSP
jgi:hypothetical protein